MMPSSNNNNFSCEKCGSGKKLLKILNGENTDEYRMHIYYPEKHYPTLCKKCFVGTSNDFGEVKDYTIKCCNCKLLFNEYLFYKCSECRGNACSNACIKLTGCQTTNCICKKRFNKLYKKGKCIQCQENNIKYHRVYLDDGSPSPYCGKCE